MNAFLLFILFSYSLLFYFFLFFGAKWYQVIRINVNPKNPEPPAFFLQFWMNSAIPVVIMEGRPSPHFFSFALQSEELLV